MGDGEKWAYLRAGSEDRIWGWPGCGMGWSRTFLRPSLGSPFWEQCRDMDPNPAKGACMPAAKTKANL